MTEANPPSDALRAHLAMRRLILEQDFRREVAEVTGMSFFRSRVLRRLAVRPMRMSELAALLGTDKPYISVVVDDLEKRGLVTRTVSADDRRVKVVALTDAGSAVAAEAEAVLSRPAKGLAALSAGELETLTRLLEKAAAADVAAAPRNPLEDQDPI
jgi:DNA-binding MarR family transcriptional regulator